MAEDIASGIVDYLAIHPEESVEKTAVVCDDRELSFGDLDNLGARCRRVFKDLGLERGDRVALIMCDCPEWVLAFLGAIDPGAVVAPCSTTLSSAEVRATLNDCGSHRSHHLGSARACQYINSGRVNFGQFAPADLTTQWRTHLKSSYQCSPHRIAAASGNRR